MRTRLICFTIMAVLLVAAPRLSVSQQDSTASKAAAQQVVPKHYYKLNFILRETDEGKVLNQRTFGMDISAEPAHVGGVIPTGGTCVLACAFRSPAPKTLITLT